MSNVLSFVYASKLVFSLKKPSQNWLTCWKTLQIDWSSCTVCWDNHGFIEHSQTVGWQKLWPQVELPVPNIVVYAINRMLEESLIKEQSPRRKVWLSKTKPEVRLLDNQNQHPRWWFPFWHKLAAILLPLATGFNWFTETLHALVS